jgi:hypothetical protein
MVTYTQPLRYIRRTNESVHTITSEQMIAQQSPYNQISLTFILAIPDIRQAWINICADSIKENLCHI